MFGAKVGTLTGGTTPRGDPSQRWLAFLARSDAQRMREGEANHH